MDYRIDEALEVLARTPSVLSSFLSGLSPAWAEGDEGPHTFSPLEVVGHLLSGERSDWMARVLIILEHGEEVPFEPFDRFAHRELDRGKTLEDLLAEFADARRGNLAALEALELGATDLERTGSHPALGRVTLRQLLAAWVAHDLGHLAQISRVMAKQYSDEVGPWHEYLPVLSDRTG